MITSIIGSAIQDLTRRADRLDVVGDDAALGDEMAGGDDAMHQQRARLVVLDVARVGDGEHRNLQRHELFVLVNPGHGTHLTTLTAETADLRGKLLGRHSVLANKFCTSGRVIDDFSMFEAVSFGEFIGDVTDQRDRPGSTNA